MSQAATGRTPLSEKGELPSDPGDKEIQLSICSFSSVSGALERCEHAIRHGARTEIDPAKFVA